MVFADTKKDSSALPQGVRDVRAKGGGTIPMVFVTTADGKKGIDAIPYNVLKEDMRKANRELKKTLETVDVLDSGVSAESDSGADGVTSTDEPAPTSASNNGLFAESQAWTNSDGKTITAAIKSVSDDSVKFIMADGRALDYPLAKLSDDSRKKIEELKGAAN
ncbi:MAG: hypothetical protein HKN23_13675 [Verrucomicrobiales bacterium]|nr:hypothetical protein [Verrucomicrobiales bacterium]